MSIVKLRTLAQSYFEKETVEQLEDILAITDTIDYGDLVFVSSLDDLPAPVAGVITLEANHTYQLTKSLNLAGNRLYCPNRVAITGYSPETCILSGTVPAGQALITAEDTLQLRSISLSTPNPLSYCVSMDGTGKSNVVVDWFAVNFLSGTAGTFKNMDNFIYLLGAVLPPANGFIFDGSFNTIALELSLLNLSASGFVGVNILPTCTVNRRFRFFNSSIIALHSGSTGISVQPSSLVDPETCIFSFLNFSGPGTKVDGITYLSDFARWRECRGIKNTTRAAQLYWSNSALNTTIPSRGTPVKVNAVTTANPLNQRFTHTNNRLTYISTYETDFAVSAIISATAGNNNILSVYIYKNGVLVPGSIQTATTAATGTGRADNLSTETIVSLAQNDYIEIWVSNNSATTSVMASSGSLIIKEIS